MDDLNGREDTPKNSPAPIGITHISPNEQRWFAPSSEDLQAAGETRRRNARQPLSLTDQSRASRPERRNARALPVHRGYRRAAMKKAARRPPLSSGAKRAAQAKLASAKSQFASEFRKVSTNFGRRLRWSM